MGPRATGMSSRCCCLWRHSEGPFLSSLLQRKDKDGGGGGEAILAGLGAGSAVRVGQRLLYQFFSFFFTFPFL